MKEKDIMTMSLCTNATGRHAFPISLIGSAKNPKAFGIRSCPLQYFSQTKAWNDGLTCNKWFHQMFLPQVRNRTTKKVALIMVNASSHGASLPDPGGQVSVVFFNLAVLLSTNYWTAALLRQLRFAISMECSRKLWVY